VPLAFVRLVVAVAAAWAGAPTDASSDAGARALVVPLVVTGELEPAWRQELAQRVRAGLERGDTEIIVASAPVTCRDATCWRDAARTSEAAFVVIGTVAIVERDYDLRMEVHSARDGAIVVRVDQHCELCGIGEAAQQLSDLAAAVADKVDALASARAVFAIESAPGGAAIALDGAPVGKAPLLVRDVVPGTHTVTASRSGYGTQTRDVEAAAGVQQLVRFELLPAQAERAPLRQLGWAALGLGGAAVVAGAPLVAIDERPVTSRCTGENVNAFGVCKYRHDTLTGGAVLIALGAAAIVAGTVIAVVTRKRSRAHAHRLGPGLALRF
jgi:PEGA domain